MISCTSPQLLVEDVDDPKYVVNTKSLVIHSLGCTHAPYVNQKYIPGFDDRCKPCSFCNPSESEKTINDFQGGSL